MKRYIVFVSSTKQTLEEERIEVINSIIKLNYMPASMEFFPASNLTSWNYIQNVIDTCDYYILILGARYGSIDQETGLSYTEREFKYALGKGIPILAFLHYDPGKLPMANFDNKSKLFDFYEFVKKATLCNMWKNKDDLSSMVTTSLIQLVLNNPQTGWVKADEQLSEYISHPANNFMLENILNLLKAPYRENLEARVDYSYINDEKFLLVNDEVSYKCRSVNGSIIKLINWSVYASELNDFIKISIKLKKQDGKEVTILNENDFTGNLVDDEYRFQYLINDEWNVDNLLVVVEASYLIPIDHFISWEMPELTYQFTLTMTFPKDLEIFYVPYMLKYKDRSIKSRLGFSSYKFYNWVIPNEGLSWQFRKINK